MSDQDLENTVRSLARQVDDLMLRMDEVERLLREFGNDVRTLKLKVPK